MSSRIISTILTFGVAGSVLVSATSVDAGLASASPRAIAKRPSVKTVEEAVSIDPSLATNRPYYWGWHVFAQINQPAETTGRPVWETWATDAETFPSCPDPDAPPAWPAGDGRNKRLEERRSLINPGGGLAVSWYQLVDGVPTAVDSTDTEEIKRNRASFEYIMDNGLYYTEGLAAIFGQAEDAVDAVDGSPSAAVPAVRSVIDFPKDAIEIKANWVSTEYIPAAQRSQYYTNYAIATDDEGNDTMTEYALISFHIMTKDIPNWFWVSWLNKNVLGRCDFYGCRDEFGVDPPYTPPNELVNYPYPPDKATEAVKALLSSYGVDPVFSHYRMVGTQTSYTDATGQPTLLSNVIAEQGFDSTGSCMTCHMRAAVDETGSTISITSAEASDQTPPANSTAVTDNGAPDPSWFWEWINADDFFSSDTRITGINAVSVDFVWGMQNAASAEGCTE